MINMNGKNRERLSLFDLQRLSLLFSVVIIAVFEEEKGKRIEIANAQSCVSACVHACSVNTATIILSTREREKRIFSVLSRTMPCVTHNTTFSQITFQERATRKTETGRHREREREREKNNKKKTNQARSCMRECRLKLRHIHVDVIKWV